MMSAERPSRHVSAATFSPVNTRLLFQQPRRFLLRPMFVHIDIIIFDMPPSHYYFRHVLRCPPEAAAAFFTRCCQRRLC